jgi:diguanylate cyclase (GGDEF)-like protein
MHVSIVTLLREILTSLSLVLGVLALRAWQRRRLASEAPIFSLLIASAALYCFGYAQEMAQTTVAGAAFWLHIEYLGIPWSPGLWLLCARRHCGMRSRTVLLFTIPVIAFVAQETNSLHHFYIRSMDMLPRGPFWVLDMHRGPLSWLHIGYLNFGLLYGGWLYIARRKQGGRTLLQTAVVVGSSLAPLGGYMVYLAGWSPWGLDLGPLMMSVTVVFGYIAVFRFGLMDLMPMARSLVFHSMRDAVIVTDLQGRLVDFNPAARELMPLLDEAKTGQELTCVLNGSSELVDALLGPDGTQRLALSWQGETQHFDVRVFPLYRDKQRAGSAAILANITAQVRLMDELQHSAETDALTGVANRRSFLTSIQRECARCARHGEPFSVAVLDVDNFKAVNDGNGHHVGDSVLLIVADRILQCLRESDLLSRFGGDEFAILFPQTDAEGALDVAERIREIVAASAVDVDGERVRATVSIGVATQDEADGTNWEQLLKQADKALYDAKARGRNQVAAWDELAETAGGR